MLRQLAVFETLCAAAMNPKPCSNIMKGGMVQKETLVICTGKCACPAQTPAAAMLTWQVSTCMGKPAEP